MINDSQLTAENPEIAVGVSPFLMCVPDEGWKKAFGPPFVGGGDGKVNEWVYSSKDLFPGNGIITPGLKIKILNFGDLGGFVAVDIRAKDAPVQILMFHLYFIPNSISRKPFITSIETNSVGQPAIFLKP